ncbi:MAG: hypothetical protein ACR2G5_01260, partial [Pyrinomonadaceae bacterium]
MLLCHKREGNVYVVEKIFCNFVFIHTLRFCRLRANTVVDFSARDWLPKAQRDATTTIDYRVYIPAGYDPAKKYPVIFIF